VNLSEEVSAVTYIRTSQRLKPHQSCQANVTAEEGAEKVPETVIPSEARDLLLREIKEKSRFLGRTQPSE